MSFTFYFEDGSGNIVDENGHDPMDIIEEENPFVRRANVLERAFFLYLSFKSNR